MMQVHENVYPANQLPATHQMTDIHPALNRLIFTFLIFTSSLPAYFFYAHFTGSNQLLSHHHVIVSSTMQGTFAAAL